MPLTPIQCANCGAQYRLPETFQADKAKCKKCGAAIDVAAQRNARPAAEPAPRKSAATPARRDRAPSPGTAAESSATRRPSGARAGASRRAEAAEDEGKHHSHHAHAHQRRGLPVVPIVFGLLTVGAIAIAIWGLTGGDEAKHTAATTPVGTATPQTPATPDRLAAMRTAAERLPETDRMRIAAFLDASASGKADAAGLREVSDESMLRLAAASLEIAGAGDEAVRLTGLAGRATIDATQRDALASVVSAVAQSGASPVDGRVLAGKLSAVGARAEAIPATAASDPAAAPAPPTPTPPTPANPEAAKTEAPPPAGPFDPKSLAELPWPDFVTAEERDNVTALLTKMRESSGAPATRARKELEKLGPKTLVGITNTLRGLDYRNCDEAMYGYELNQALRAVTGKNAQYKTCATGEVVPDKDVDWNARTVKVWHDFAKQNSTPEAFAKLVEGLQKKKAEEEKND